MKESLESGMDEFEKSNRHLFDRPMDPTDSYGVIKNYFDLMYNDDLFLDAVENIIQKNHLCRMVYIATFLTWIVMKKMNISKAFNLLLVIHRLRRS
ncbi:Uncharacterised protein [Serratia proteamaculans]|nr:Uncharacterised protein [Serratia proteamaculans]